ncbi:HMG box domain-containing protein [Plasmodiophora brassicae]|nr:hypothetical protein PBRA_004185 [Plasmodiophora brassicae]
MVKGAAKTKSPTKKAAKGAGKKEKPAVKRGLSAYMFFVQANRVKIKEDNPDATFGELGKILGQKWKELDEKEKAPYEKLAAADKARYEKDKKAAS